MSVSRYNGDTPRGLEVFAMKKNAMNPHRLAVLAMMTAVVFAVNFPRIIIPLPTGETSFTLANIACVLSGMLLGPLGGLASGLGSALYDLTNPIFAPECWLTFLTKGAMGLAAGLVFRTPEQRETASYRRCLASSLVGCLTYYLLYFSKSLFYDNMLVGGLLAYDCQVLVCDEPTYAQDRGRTAAIMDALQQEVVERGLTLILSTHDRALAQDYADILYELKEGSLYEVAQSRL